MNRYEDAMHWQERLLDYWQSAEGVGFGEGYAASMDWEPVTRRLLPLTQVEALKQADPIYVSDEVLTIVDHARESFEPEVVLPTDPFTLCGFALLPKAIIVKDRFGYRTGIRAMLWMPISGNDAFARVGNGGVMVCLYSHVSDDDDFAGPLAEMRAAARAQGDDFHLSEMSLVHYGFIMFNAEAWKLSDPDFGPKPLPDSGSPEEDQRAATEYWTLMQTFWRIAQQTIRVPERAARPWRRRAQRKGLPEEVTVVRLRKASNTQYEGEGECVEWDHRWLVRGHWRNQWYPSLQSHRQVWINPYVKGPEDKPIVVTKRAFEFTR